jgi:branched-chain amino acid transport system substrate-binding protein
MKLSTFTAAALVLFGSQAIAQNADNVFRVGVIGDMSGPFSHITGRGSVEAVKLAIEDAGGKAMGKRIEVLTGDDQNKPDVAAVLVRKWFDVDRVDVVVSGSGSAAAFAEMTIAKEKDKTLLLSGAGSSDITGKLCHRNITHWAFDTYGLASTVGRSVVADGGNTWYFITIDYALGHTIERDTTKVIEDNGGKVLGSVRHPIGASDMSSFLLQAQASKAQVIGLATAGTDLINSIKAANQFGITKNQRLAGLLLYVNDVQALGLPMANGLVGVTSFYHDQNEATRAWTKRYMERFPGKNIPNMVQAGAYSAMNHYLKTVNTVGTSESGAVSKKMRETPVNDMYNNNVQIRQDGRVLHDMMQWQAKSPQESTGPNDLLSIRKTIPGKLAFRSEADSECPLLASGKK